MTICKLFRQFVVALSLLLTSSLFSQDKAQANTKPAGFFRAETSTYIVEVSNSLPQTFLTDCKNSLIKADQFFTQVFKLPPGILTGNANENSIAFSKFAEKLKQDTKFGGKIPKNLYEEWFHVAGKIHFRIWDKQVLFANEWFDMDKVPEEKRASMGIPGAYIAWNWFDKEGNLITNPDKNKDLLRRVIRSFVGDRLPKEVLASLYHEVGHLYLTSYLMSYSDVPAWLNEGFAELFAYALPSDKKTKRKINRNKAVLYELVQTNEFWKFDEFLTIDNAHNLKMVADKSHKSEIVYTQAWSVVEFLTSSPNFSAKFLAFLEDLRNDSLVAKYQGKRQNMFELQKGSFKQTFGADMSNLEKYWVKHVNSKYKKDLEAHPENNYFIGDFYLRRGNKDKAQEFFAIAAEKAPQFAESHMGLGRLAYTSKNFDEAALHFEDAIKIESDNSEALIWLGYSYINTGKFKEANNAFAKAYDLESEDQDLLYGYGETLFYTGNYTEAARVYEQGYEKSRNINCLFGQGKALFMSKEYNSSRRILSALSTTNNNPEISFWIGAASAHLKDKEYALTELEKATKTNHRYVNYAKAYVEALNNGSPLPEVKP